MRLIRLAFCYLILAGCSGGNGSSPPLADGTNDTTVSAVQRSASSIGRLTPTPVFKTIYSFKGGSDGAYPIAGVMNVNGELYGTTQNGGSAGNFGTVYQLNASGVESVVYAFQGPPADGALASAGLISVDGTFYGTTPDGGSGNCAKFGCGTVFTISPSGAESVLYSFKAGVDGAQPEAALTNIDGTLYGTTNIGGVGAYCYGVGCGTVYAISPSGTETVLYSFQGGADGANPQGTLLDVNGILYGTTREGGASGVGTVFEVTTSGTERVLYAFKGQPDGAAPEAGLTNVNGILYGTTYGGGNGKSCGNFGCGTVFNLTTAGQESVLYSFRGRKDGESPSAGLTNVNGKLYGTTGFGGGYGDKYGSGTVFEISTSGKETLLHAFGSLPSDGSVPLSGLTNVNGTLYGTTFAVGGTVFSLTL